MACVTKRVRALLRSVRHGARATAGFTMVELLAAVAILAILGTLVASAMATGSRVMADATTASNASVLEQSIDTALTDVLRFASVHTNEGFGEEFDGPMFDSDSTTDAAGAPVRGGYLGVEDGHIVLVTSAGSVSIPKSRGIYTDFTVREDSFSLKYNTASKLFTGSYTLVGNGGLYERTCTFACRTLVDNTPVLDDGSRIDAVASDTGTSPSGGGGSTQPVEPVPGGNGSDSGSGGSSGGGPGPGGGNGGGGSSDGFGNGEEFVPADDEIIEIGDGSVIGV